MYDPSVPQPHQISAARPSRKRVYILATVAALVAAGVIAVVIAVSTGSNSAPTIHVHGTVSLTDPSGYDTLDPSSKSIIQGGGGSPGDPCISDGGYTDISSGTQVIISDDSGKTLSITSLGDGTLVDDACTFSFTTSVPADHAFYGVAVAARGTVKEPKAQMSDVQLSLGS